MAKAPVKSPTESTIGAIKELKQMGETERVTRLKTDEGLPKPRPTRPICCRTQGKTRIRMNVELMHRVRPGAPTKSTGEY